MASPSPSVHEDRRDDKVIGPALVGCGSSELHAGARPRLRCTFCTVLLLFAVPARRSHAQTPARNYSGQFLVAFALGPMLTFFLIRAEDGGRGGEEGSAGDGEWDETAPQPDNYVLTEG